MVKPNIQLASFKQFVQLSGLNVQHDANHGAISKNPNVNRFFGSFQNWIGGSAISWIHQHVVQVKLDNAVAGLDLSHF